MKRPPLGAVLAHPIPIVALVALVLNDHVLKARFPGVVTGKLSDLAGMVLAPLVLVALADALAPARVLARRGWESASAWVCAAAIAIGFALVKTWAPATHAYDAAFGLLWRGHVDLVRDPTDLVALPLGALAARVGARRVVRDVPARATITA